MSPVATTSETDQKPLPRIRTDIEMQVAPDRAGGFPALVVTDPARGSYFRLNWPESGILLHWQEASDVEDLKGLLLRTYGLAIDIKDIEAVAEFAFANQLTMADPAGGWQRYAAIRKAGQHGILKSLIHGYLFFRIPILHPEAALQRLLPYLGFVYARLFWLIIATVALCGTYLATRQWSAVIAAAHDALRLEGLLLHAAALLGLKAVHELGHALTTVRYGCRVPSMGLAFMLGAPVLYTDTSDSWRLSSRAQRLSIVFAGVSAEMIVATFAIILWVFLPEGSGRQICFALATTSVALSLAVNLNPFMRFDGYFALSDYLEVPNLQSRAFALGIWRLREFLFGLGHRPPEVLPRRLTRTLVLYAYVTWFYRVGLYLGIAAVVYMMAGKALGIVLGLFEVVVFLARPVWSEMQMWWQMRTQILRPGRATWTGAALAASLVVFVVPWMTTIEAPSVFTAATEEALHLPFAARLQTIDVVDGQHVEAGQILFTADSSDLDRIYAKTTIEKRSLEMQTNRLHASDKELETRLIVRSKLAQAVEKLAALDRQKQQLVIRAPFDGTIVDLDVEISAGIWLNTKQPLARLVAEGPPRVRSLVAETDVARLSAGTTAVFVGEDPTAPRRELKLVSIAPASDGRLIDAALADRHGGGVPAGEERGELRTRQSWFEVKFDAEGARPSQLLRGTALVEASSTSPLNLVWRQICRVLVREQGF
jgi:putative peptide zinc metalloprotease protein